MKIDFDKIYNQLAPLVTTWGVRIIGALIGLVVAFVVAGMVKSAVETAMRRSKVDETLTRFAGKLARWAVLAAGIVALLGVFGIQTASFAAIIGAAGLAIGLGFQGTLGSLAAGVMLIVFRPFKVGDVVTVSGVTGKVYAIELFVTTLDTPDNRRIILPNKSVFGSTIENISFHDTRRVDVAVGTDYGADLDETRAVLLKAANSIGEQVLQDPAPAIVIGELADSCITWTVRVWVNAADFWPVKDALTVAVKKHLDEAKVGIPYPQMDVHMDKVA